MRLFCTQHCQVLQRREQREYSVCLLEAYSLTRETWIKQGTTQDDVQFSIRIRGESEWCESCQGRLPRRSYDLRKAPFVLSYIRKTNKRALRPTHILKKLATPDCLSAYSHSTAPMGISTLPQSSASLPLLLLQLHGPVLSDTSSIPLCQCLRSHSSSTWTPFPQISEWSIPSLHFILRSSIREVFPNHLLHSPSPSLLYFASWHSPPLNNSCWFVYCFFLWDY